MSFCFEQNTWILHELECPVCTEYMHPPIKQCVKGHSICETCFSKLERCPTCRNTMANARCYVLEQLHSKLYFPCRNKDDGCPLVSSGAVIKQHEKSCVYGVQPCPLKVINRCPWQGHVREMVKHCKTKHPLNMYSTNKQTLACKNFLKASTKNSYYILFAAYNQLFKCVWHVDYDTKIMKWCVFYIGQKELSYRFSYEIEFANRQKCFQKITLMAPCQPISQEAFAEDENYLLTHYDMIKTYCKDQDLIYTVKILCKY